PDHRGSTGGGVGYTLRHCAYFNTGEQCHFCSITPEQKHRQEIGIEGAQTVADTIEQTKAATKQRVAEVRAQYGPYLDANIPCGQDNCSCIRSNMTIGALGTYEAEVAYHYSRIRAMREAVPGLPIHLTAGAIKEADAKALAELGVHALCENLEVWDEKLFQWICAGKAKHVGRDEWIDRIVSAVKYYPRGHVYSNFVAGVEMAQPHGFKTVDEALKSTLGGWEWLMQQGVSVYWQIWATAPGSLFQDQVLPPTEFYLSLAEEWYKLIRQYDLFRATTHWCCKRCNNNPQGPFNRMRWYPGGFPPDNTLRPERPLEEMLAEREQGARQRKLVAAKA
ncbi:MAG: hypothetical protein Q7O66_20150, partial [Dehalococcoidia bacterium]|nr:hypothetical protein [Dehalococcoidia bacterium]